MFMSFNLNESSTCINIKLTDAGRRQLSLGRLKFAKVVFSDREIDYGIDRSGNYEITNNRILSPSDAHPDIDTVNLDGTNAWTLTNQHISVAKIFTTGSCSNVQMFYPSYAEGFLYFNENIDKSIESIDYNAQSWNTNVITFSSPTTLDNGDLLLLVLFGPQAPSIVFTNNFASVILASDASLCLWYRIISGASSTQYVLDRPLPRYTASISHPAKVYVFPSNAMETYYGTGATQNTAIWNMNIVRTKPIAGTILSGGTISGHTRYGSLEHSGTKQYFGFRDETPAVGFIHHTNMFSGTSIGEQLIEKTVKISLPGVLWHRNTTYTGYETQLVNVFFDEGGDTQYDPVAKSTFRYLSDNRIFSAATIVGKVYHKLKTIVITDQEILAASSYKSNRNYTYPEPIVTLGPTPNFPLTTNQATGLCKTGYTYFVTYIPESDSYGATTSFGHPDALHCAYIKKIDGQSDINGNPQFLNVTFPQNSFPFMRTASELSASGTGWNANYVQILVNEQPTAYNYDIANVPSDGWKRVSVRSSGGNGVYKGSTYGDNTIDRTKLNNHRFVISQQDFTSGSTYVLYSGMTANQDVLNFGDESFFFGLVEADYLRTNYKSLISVYATDTQFLESKNSTFDWTQDEHVYVSEVAVLDEKDQVVAVGKPTYPLKKEPNRFLTFQLEVNF